MAGRGRGTEERERGMAGISLGMKEISPEAVIMRNHLK
jgi:hypothetical protein